MWVFFPKKILYEQGILSDKNNEGKRGFRVYPPWDEITTNNQAKDTQTWQLKYFLEIKLLIYLQKSNIWYIKLISIIK